MLQGCFVFPILAIIKKMLHVMAMVNSDAVNIGVHASFFFLILHNCISFAKYQNESATGILLKRLVHSWSKRSYICSIKGRNVPTSPPPQFLWIKNSYFLICYDRREKSIYMFSCNHKNIYCLTLGLQRKFSRKPLYCLVNCKINSPSALQQHKNCLGRVNESRYCQQ